MTTLEAIWVWFVLAMSIGVGIPCIAILVIWALGGPRR